jgi:hypothetical protein
MSVLVDEKRYAGIYCRIHDSAKYICEECQFFPAHPPIATHLCSEIDLRTCPTSCRLLTIRCDLYSDSGFCKECFGHIFSVSSDEHMNLVCRFCRDKVKVNTPVEFRQIFMRCTVMCYVKYKLVSACASLCVDATI